MEANLAPELEKGKKFKGMTKSLKPSRGQILHICAYVHMRDRRGGGLA